MRRDFDEHDQAEDPDAIPGAILCSCGALLDEPDGPGPDLDLPGVCDGCGAEERRQLDEQQHEQIALDLAGPPDDEGQPPW